MLQRARNARDWPLTRTPADVQVDCTPGNPRFGGSGRRARSLQLAAYLRLSLPLQTAASPQEVRGRP